MCGIVGFYSKKKTSADIALLRSVVEETKIRGLHAFGTAYFKGKKLKVLKSLEFDFDYLFGDFIDSKSSRIVFHCRYSTSGDFKDMDNNQPIVVKNKAIVMNGVISMAKKEKYEKRFKVSCKTSNDSEIILRSKLSTLDFLKEYERVSFAGLFLRKDKIIGLRNNKRPMYSFSRGLSKFIVSTKDIAKRSGIKTARPCESFKFLEI